MAIGPMNLKALPPNLLREGRVESMARRLVVDGLVAKLAVAHRRSRRWHWLVKRILRTAPNSEM